jgi:hypothetical protein
MLAVHVGSHDIMAARALNRSQMAPTTLPLHSHTERCGKLFKAVAVPHAPSITNIIPTICTDTNPLLHDLCMPSEENDAPCATVNLAKALQT